MSVRALVVLALAVICGGSSLAGLFIMHRRSTADRVETVAVVVASREILRGEVVTDSNVVTRQWVVDQVPPNAIGDIAEVLDRTVMTPILPGEVVISGKLADRKSGRGLAALIPEGQRAYTIQSSRVASSVAGFVLPGNRVDVLLTLRGNSNDSTGGGSSTTLLQAVEILAVDQRLDAPTENRMDPQQLRSVTLLVTPDQASLLDLGQNMGTLALSLRSPGDLAEADTVPATLNVLRFTQREPVITDVVANKPVIDSAASNPPSLLAAAAATAAKAALIGLPAATSRPEPRKPRFEQIQTLRGRHPGRILVRTQR